MGILAVRRPLAALVAMVAVTIALAACGGGATPSPVVTPEPTAAPATASPAIEPSPMPEPSAAVTIYVVKKGDTMIGIAKKFGITVKALQAANPQVSDPRLMQIGEKLVIPVP